MAQQTIETTDTLNAGRVKINANFSELYAADWEESEILALIGGDWETVPISSNAGTLNANSEKNVKAKFSIGATTSLTLASVNAHSQMLLAITKTVAGFLDVNLLGSGLTFKNRSGATITGFKHFGGSGDIMYVPLVVDGTTVTVFADIPFEVEQQVSGTVIDWTISHHYKTLSANTTFTFSNTTLRKTIQIAITNTASNYTVTWPTVDWGSQGAPVQRVGAVTDIYTFTIINGTIYGAVRQ